uniref:CHK kinase-like domain-containing protein n=2 Tax=Lutzomyia longipalpis TaxID=7200 RepID=A0A1B0C986_LUTLO
MVMEKLAKMHASTVVLEEKNPGMFDHFNQGIFNRTATAFLEFFLMHLDIFIEEVSTWDDYKQYAAKLKKVRNDLNERASQVYDPSKEFMNVLIHGDLWTNNIMFTFDEKNRPTDLLFVDLQFSTWTSPVVDILYFAHNSLKEELRQGNIPELIQYYHTHLTTLLKKMNSKKKIPTLREMHVMVLEKEFMAFLAGVMMQPIMLVEDSTNADMDTMISDSEASMQFKRNLYRNPKTKTALKFLLPYLDQRGIKLFRKYRMPVDIKTVACADSDIPNWLNQPFFENILRKRKKENEIFVDSLQLEFVGGKGENYASTLYRGQFTSTLNRNQRRYSLIVKTTYEDNQLANDILSEYNIFKQEMEMYDQVLPEYHRLLRSIGDYSQISPKSIFCDYQNSIIVFEDLSIKGFQMADRKVRLDREHAELVLMKLAKLHAASVVVDANATYNVKKYKTGMFNRKTSGVSSFFLTNLDALINCISKWKGYEYYVAKLEKMRLGFEEKARELYDPKEDVLNVLIHGDLWTNNVMFKYNNQQRPIDVQIVDYQFMCWAPATVDLYYFFHTSLTEELRQTAIDELVQFYHHHLSETLQKLGLSHKTPTLHAFQISMLKGQFAAFIYGLLSQPIMLIDGAAATEADFNAIIGLDSRSLQFKENVYKNEKVHCAIRHLLPQLDRKGLLDC